MKFSICTTWAKDKSLEEVIETASALKLEGIEIWDGHIDDFLTRREGGLQELKRLLDEKGVACAAIAPYFKLLKKEDAQNSIRTAEKCIMYAKTLGAEVIRTFVGNKPSREVAKEEWECCISALKSMMALVKNENIYFALETHNNQPTDTAEAVLYILEQTGSDKLKVIFDGYNYLSDNINMMDAYEKLKKYIVHYHMKNYLNEGKRSPAALNQGDVDFKALFLDVIQSKYSGYVSFEYLRTQPEPFIKESLAWIESLFLSSFKF